jgi:phage terminase large subunit-like protein
VPKICPFSPHTFLNVVHHLAPFNFAVAIMGKADHVARADTAAAAAKAQVMLPLRAPEWHCAMAATASSGDAG